MAKAKKLTVAGKAKRGRKPGSAAKRVSSTKSVITKVNREIHDLVHMVLQAPKHIKAKQTLLHDHLRDDVRKVKGTLSDAVAEVSRLKRDLDKTKTAFRGHKTTANKKRVTVAQNLVEHAKQAAKKVALQVKAAQAEADVVKSKIAKTASLERLVARFEKELSKAKATRATGKKAKATGRKTGARRGRPSKKAHATTHTHTAA